jgi:hypothetical protein
VAPSVLCSASDMMIDAMNGGAVTRILAWFVGPIYLIKKNISEFFS